MGAGRGDKGGKGRGDQTYALCSHVAGALYVMLVLGSAFTFRGICGCLVTLSGHTSVDWVHSSIRPTYQFPSFIYPSPHLPTWPAPCHIQPPTQPAPHTRERQTWSTDRGSSPAAWLATWRLLKVALPCEGTKDPAASLGAAEPALGSWAPRIVIAL